MSEYPVHRLDERVADGRIKIACSCGRSINVSDNGMGRATAAAFRTSHQSSQEG